MKLDHEPVPGDLVRVKMMGKSCMVTVVDVTEKTITIDANHPLAGETITYTITVAGILPRAD